MPAGSGALRRRRQGRLPGGGGTVPVAGDTPRGNSVSPVPPGPVVLVPIVVPGRLRQDGGIRLRPDADRAGGLAEAGAWVADRPSDALGVAAAGRSLHGRRADGDGGVDGGGRHRVGGRRAAGREDEEEEARSRRQDGTRHLARIPRSARLRDSFRRHPGLLGAAELGRRRRVAFLVIGPSRSRREGVDAPPRELPGIADQPGNASLLAARLGSDVLEDVSGKVQAHLLAPGSRWSLAGHALTRCACMSAPLAIPCLPCLRNELGPFRDVPNEAPICTVFR